MPLISKWSGLPVWWPVLLVILTVLPASAQDKQFDAGKYLQQRSKANQGVNLNAGNAQQLYNEEFEKALRSMMPADQQGQIPGLVNRLHQEEAHPLQLDPSLKANGTGLETASGCLFRNPALHNGNNVTVQGTAIQGDYEYVSGVFKPAQTVPQMELGFGGGLISEPQRRRVMQAAQKFADFCRAGDTYVLKFPISAKGLLPYIVDSYTSGTTDCGGGVIYAYHFRRYPTVTAVDPLGVTLPDQPEFCLGGVLLDQITAVVLGGTPLEIASRAPDKVCLRIPADFQGGLRLTEQNVSGSASAMLEKSLVPLLVRTSMGEASFMCLLPGTKTLTVYRSDGGAGPSGPPENNNMIQPATPQAPKDDHIFCPGGYRQLKRKDYDAVDPAGPYRGVAGRLFYDSNWNCKYDPENGDTPADFECLRAVLSVQNETWPEVDITDSEGHTKRAPDKSQKPTRWWETLDTVGTLKNGSFFFTNAIPGKHHKIELEIPVNHVTTCNWEGSQAFFKQDVQGSGVIEFDVEQVNYDHADLGIMRVPKLEFSTPGSNILPEGNSADTITNAWELICSLDRPWHAPLNIWLFAYGIAHWPKDNPSHATQDIPDFQLQSPWTRIEAGQTAATNYLWIIPDDYYESDEPVWVTVNADMSDRPLVYPGRAADGSLPPSMTHKFIIQNDDVDIIWKSALVAGQPAAQKPPFLGNLHHLPDARLGETYQVNFTVQGPLEANPHWQIGSETISDGLTLDPATGILSGTPQSMGAFEGDFLFRVDLQAEHNQRASKWFYLQVNGPPGQPAHPHPPIIVQQPPDKTVRPGQKTELEVEALGAVPLRYQWRKFDPTAASQTDPPGWADVPNTGGTWGSHTAGLRFDSMESPNAGNYRVFVSNPGGSVTSRVAHLSLDLSPTNQLNTNNINPRNEVNR